MNSLIVLAGLVSLGIGAQRELWQKFKLTHEKSYKTLLEEQNRFNIFLKNLKLIEEHNKRYASGEVTYKLGVNKFTDMTDTEFSASFSKFKITNKDKTSLKLSKVTPVPHKIDWRQRGAVTTVRDQGSCGACWAISAVGSLEGQFFLKNGTLMSLSPQLLLDCASDNLSCFGGTMNSAFRFIEEQGIESEKDYPFEANFAKCRYKKNKVLFKISGHANVESNEDKLKQAVGTIGPISAAVSADQYWKSYAEGIFINPECPTDFESMDHGILVVGYGTSNGLDYWLIKNSWGKTWGEKGYIRLARNADNQCGIANLASYPYF